MPLLQVERKKPKSQSKKDRKTAHWQYRAVFFNLNN
jgi:hypothetical protein